MNNIFLTPSENTSDAIFSKFSDKPKISSENAMKIGVVNACVRLISGAIADLSLKAFKKNGIEIESKISDLINLKPNNFLTGFEFKELILVHVLLYGDAFVQIRHNILGEVVDLIPINPRDVVVRIENYEKFFDVFINKNGMQEKLTLRSDEVIHIKNTSRDLYQGENPINLAKGSLEMLAYAEMFSKQVLATNGSPLGIITHPGNLSSEAKKNIKKSWGLESGGVNKKNSTQVLDEGMKYEEVKINASDLQFLESRNYQVKEICSIFGVPPALIDPSVSSVGSVEQLTLHFVKFTLRHWVAKIESVLTSQLGNGKIFFRFDMDELLRGDISTRYQAYAVGINRFLTVNEVRRLENLQPVEHGDEETLKVALNLGPLDYDISKVNNIAQNQINGAKGNINVPKEDKISLKGTQDVAKMETKSDLELEYIKRGIEIICNKEKTAINNIINSTKNNEDLYKKMESFEKNNEKLIKNSIEFLKNEQISTKIYEIFKIIVNSCKKEGIYSRKALESYFNDVSLNKLIFEKIV